MDQAIIDKTIEQVKTAADLAKVTGALSTTGSVLQGYDLEQPAKNLYSVLHPIRDRLPRTPGAKGSIAVHWKQVTALVGASNIFVAEGARNSALQYTTADQLATYKTQGLDDLVTAEAEWTARGFDDLRARSSVSLLQQVMIQEEDALIGANVTNALGAIGTPTAAAVANTASTLTTNSTYFVRCCALTHLGWTNSTNKGPNPTAVPTLGAFHGAISAEGGGAGVSITSGTNMLSATVVPVPGAVAYAWFVGTTTGSANLKLEKITPLNAVCFTAPLFGTGVAASTIGADATANSLQYDGIIPQLSASGSGATIVTQATLAATSTTASVGGGTGLTYDGAGGISEFDVVLKSLWDNARMSASVIYVNSQEALNIMKKLFTVSAGVGSIYNVTIDGTDAITAGFKVVRYVNKFTNGLVDIIVHPTLPPGTILFLAFNLPSWYPNPNVEGLWDVHVLQDYYEELYARTLRRFEHGVYHFDVLRGFAPFTQAMITNIGNA